MFNYAQAEYESVPCNFCMGVDVHTLSRTGQDGLPLHAVMCRNCGLIFINPRMTREWYFKYYQGEYREKTIEHGTDGRKFNIEAMYKKALSHGERLGKTLRENITHPQLIVEVGSSAGGVLKGLQNVLGGQVLGVEPSEKEANFAIAHGVKTHVALFENVDQRLLPSCSLVVCTQSLNHLLYPRAFLAWAHDRLETNGILALEVVNFRHQLKDAGKFKNAVKIDHPYMFTPEVLCDFVRSAGFEILKCVNDEDLRATDLDKRIISIHTQLIARKREGKSFSNIIHTPNLYRKNKCDLNPFRAYYGYLIKKRLPKLFSKNV